MINYFFDIKDFGNIAFTGLIFAFIATCFTLCKCTKILPKDMGRDFAHDGKLSAGKPRGAGFWFVIIFVITSAVFGKMNTEIIIYLILVVSAMLTGFLDDCAKSPWGEYKKGAIDLVIAALTAANFVYHNQNLTNISFFGFLPLPFLNAIRLPIASLYTLST